MRSEISVALCAGPPVVMLVAGGGEDERSAESNNGKSESVGMHIAGKE